MILRVVMDTRIYNPSFTIQTFFTTLLQIFSVYECLYEKSYFEYKKV